MKYFYFKLWLIVFLNACQSKQGNEKQNFLETIDIALSNEDLHARLVSAKISLKDIYAYCQKSQALQRKTKLISAAYLKVENYLEENNPEYWLAIMYDLQRFCEAIAVFKEAQHKTFIDIGSGNGEKPFGALCMGFEKSYGLEYSENLVKISQNVLKDFIQSKKIEIILGDALQTKNNFYQQIDFIYLYSPIKNHQIMAQLFDKILRNVKEGAILMEMRFVYRKELINISGYQFPEMMNLILKKEKGKLYYAKYGLGEKKWFLVDKIGD